MINPTSHRHANQESASVFDQTNEEIARYRAGVFAFIAAIFNQQPDTNWVVNLKSAGEGFWAELREYGYSNPEIQRGIAELLKFSDQIQSMDEADIENKLRTDWARLFRGLGAGYGPIPPFESLFLSNDANNVEILHNIAQIYIGFNLVSSDNVKNRHDYLGIELDFLRYLAQKEADAWADGDEAKATYYQNAFISFFSEHPNKWVASFCDQAVQEAETTFYRGFLHLVKGILQDVDVGKSLKNNDGTQITG